MQKVIINPQTDAVLGIDIMKTFMPGGGLPVDEGDMIVQPMVDLYNMFPVNRRYCVYEQHRLGHISFADSYIGLPEYYKLTYEEVKTWTSENHKIAKHARFTLSELKLYLRVVGHQTLWPLHSVEGTDEGTLHPAIAAIEMFRTVIKGQNPTRDSYSGIRDAMGKSTHLAEDMRNDCIRRVFGGGLAFQFCEGWTLLHLADEGFEVYSVKECTRAVLGEEGPEVADMREWFDAMQIKEISIADIEK